MGMKVATEPSYNYQKAVDAKTKTTKARTISMSNFGRQSPRDDLMLKQTDMYRNVILENTKEEREMELKAKKAQRSTLPTGFLNHP